MKVIVISHLYPTEAEPLGGIFVQKQIEALAACGAEVTLVNPTPWVPAILKDRLSWGKYAKVPYKDRHRGIEIYHPRVLELPQRLFFLHYGLTYRAGMTRLMAELIKEKKPDLIHAHVAHPDGAAAVEFGKQYNLPVVVTIHGQDFAHTLQRSPAYARRVKGTLSQAGRVILVSDKLHDNYGLAEWADDLTKYRVIYNGVNLAEIMANKETGTKTQAGTTAGAPILLTVGFLRKPKGHSYVLQALAGPQGLVKHYPNLTYKIVGDGAERENLEAEVKELGLQEHVIFTGSLSYQEAMAEMAACDVFVMPSWDEAFGIVYLEAMAHGKPVIGTRGEGIGPLLEKEETGLAVPPRDVQALRAALQKILSSPDLASQMGQKGQALVYSRFTWEHNAKQTLEVYQQVLDNRQHRRR